METRKRRRAVALLMAAVCAAGLLLPSGQAIAKEKKSTIDNTKEFYAIQANLTLTGSGTGWHGKLAYVNSVSAISYGIQHDEFASAPHTGKDELMVENVYSNDPGMQRYDWLGVTLEQGHTYSLMMTLNKKGDATVYLDGKALKTYHNAGLKSYNGSDINKYNANPQARVEGSARKNGDTVDAKFAKIRLKEGKYRDFKKYTSTNKWVEDGKYAFFLPQKSVLNKTIKVTSKKDTARIRGSISGLPEGQDWDSAYQSVSGVVQYQRNATYFPPDGYKDHY